MNIAAFLLACFLLVKDCETSKIFSGLFPNWAQYRDPPYTFSVRHLQGIVGRLDHIIYAYAHFNSNDYQITYTDLQDKASIKTVMYYKLSRPKLKVIVSIGGENFPSSNFSEMVNSNESRALFISNLGAFLKGNKFDGVDISWKWPCSAKKTIYSRQYQKKGRNGCDSFTEISDRGSKCPQDGTSFLSLLKEMRASLGNDTIITVTGSPFLQQIKHLPMALYAHYVNYWYVASYGYTVSAANKSYVTAPGAPLHHPPKSAGISMQNMNSTGMIIIIAVLLYMEVETFQGRRNKGGLV